MAPQDALQRLQAAGSYSDSEGEKLDWTYYDTIALLSTTLMHRFFAIPLGQAGKTLADTNLPNAGLLPQGHNLRIHGLKAWYVGTDALATADLLALYNMLNNTTIEFLVPGKATLGTWRLAEIFGSPMLATCIPTTAGNYIQQVKGDFKPVFPLNFPINVGAVQSFEVRLTHHVAPAAELDADKLVFGLRGRLLRMA